MNPNEIADRLEAEYSLEKEGTCPFVLIDRVVILDAIAALKAKSDAEVVCEWLSVPSRKIVHHVEQPRNYSATYKSLNESYTITCPTLSDLAKKLKGTT